MPAADYTVTGLLASLKRRGMIPSATGAFATSDLIAVANEELQETVVDLIVDINEEYLVATYDYSITANQASYAIPTRAIDGILRDVTVTDGGGGYYSLPRIEIERVPDYPQSGGGLQGYIVEANNVVLIPAPTTTTGTLRLKYLQRPGQLVQTTEVGTITAINTGAQTVTISSVPAGFGTSAANYDFVHANPQFENWAIDQSATRSSSVLTFAAALPATLAVGDYVCLAGQSPVPQIPYSLHSYLAQRVVCVVMAALGYQEKAQAAEAACAVKRTQALDRMKPRMQGSSRILLNRYGPGWNSKRYRW